MGIYFRLELSGERESIVVNDITDILYIAVGEKSLEHDNNHNGKFDGYFGKPRKRSS